MNLFKWLLSRPWATRKAPVVTRRAELKAWFASPSSIIELRSVLDTPSVHYAIAVLREATSPSSKTVSGDTETDALRLSYAAGYADALRELQALASPRSTLANTDSEWGHIQPNNK